MLRSILLPLAAASLVNAHFRLDKPHAEFNDDTEGQAPCGGVKVEVNGNAPEIDVDRFSVEIFSSHPEGLWSFLATTDTQEPYHFKSCVPNVKSTGIGGFCLTDIRVPRELAGKSGILQVIDHSVDGVLYQCAPVKFVSGSEHTIDPTCKNATNFHAEWQPSGPSGHSANSTVSMSMGPSGSATGQASSSSSTAAAALMTGVSGVVGLGLLAAGLVI